MPVLLPLFNSPCTKVGLSPRLRLNSTLIQLSLSRPLNGQYSVTCCRICMSALGATSTRVRVFRAFKSVPEGTSYNESTCLIQPLLAPGLRVSFQFDASSYVPFILPVFGHCSNPSGALPPASLRSYEDLSYIAVGAGRYSVS